MARGIRGVGVALGAVVTVVTGVLAACATGSTDPGATRDNCKVRDCGPSGGDVYDPLDTRVDPDTGTAPDTAPPDDTPKPEETAPPDDTGSGCKPPAGTICTTLPQCGCTSTQNCDVTGADGKTSCVAAGAKALNETCKAIGECQKGLTCVGGLCRPFCSSSTDCTGKTAGACNAVQTGTPPVDIPGFKVCFVECDPLAPSKTCGTAGCGFLSDSKTTTCSAAGTKSGAGTCAADPALCAPGYVCISPSDCRRWCRTGFPGDCPTGKTCQGFSPPAPTWKGVEYGVCTL